MKEVINLIKKKIKEIELTEASCQEDEQRLILELACLNECLSNISSFDWDYFEREDKEVEKSTKGQGWY